MKKVYLIATVIALITGLATFFIFRSVSGKKTTDEMADVVVAAVEIKENTPITADMLEVVKKPLAEAKPGFLSRIEDVEGSYAMYTIPKGEQVVRASILKPSPIGGPDQNKGKLSLELSPGEYALSVPVTLIDAVSYYPREYDYVDVYLVEKVHPNDIGQTDVNGSVYEADDMKTSLLLEGVRILRVSNYQQEDLSAANGTKITSYTEVTLRLNKEQVLKLASAMNQGTIKLALTAFGENEGETTTAPPTTAPPATEETSEAA
ncbi:MAG: Flp pilus assembly protein CpaB [Clostridiales bacterium]|jgi:Flp pilus assembly protein CpaB|nr:Flp pilus assembly protein CpaB [Clostridiales bacterium]